MLANSPDKDTLIVDLKPLKTPICVTRNLHATSWRWLGLGRGYVGSLSDLGDSEIEWNDKIKSLILYSLPGTTAWLYDSKHFRRNDDIVEIKVQEDGLPVIVNQLDNSRPILEVRDKIRKNGIADKVSGIQWR
jgi:hypothetical protein